MGRNVKSRLAGANCQLEDFRLDYLSLADFAMRFMRQEDRNRGMGCERAPAKGYAEQDSEKKCCTCRQKKGKIRLISKSEVTREGKLVTLERTSKPSLVTWGARSSERRRDVR